MSTTSKEGGTKGGKPRSVIGERKGQVTSSPKRQLMEILFQEFSTPTLTSHPPSLLTFLFPFEDNNEITHVNRPPAEAPYPFFRESQSPLPFCYWNGSFSFLSQ